MTIKIIRHRPSGIDVPDDVTLPFRLEVNLQPPEFMQVAFVCLYGGSEEIVAKGASREDLDRFVNDLKLRDHPRLRWMRVTAPDGTVEMYGYSRLLQGGS